MQAEAYDWPDEFFAERTWTVRRPGADPAELAEALRLIRAAKRPLVVAGGGVHHSRAEEALAEFAETTGIPVASTQAGKGSLRHDHPQDVGGIGHTGTATADELARTADLVIGVGTRYTDFTTASGTLFTGENVRFLNLNIASFDAPQARRAAPGRGRPHRPGGADRAAGDARPPGRAALRHRVHRGQGALGTARRRLLRGGRAGHPPDPAAGPRRRWTPVVDESDILINAAGSLPGDLHKLWRTRSYDQYHLEYGYSCMGYEIPAAIGVKMAAPDRPVWALVGDGTYLMMPTEIVTAVQEGVAIKVLIIQNHGYASIGGLSESVGGERFGTAYRFPSEDGTYTGPPLPVDLAANAASLGMRVLRAKSVRDLRGALAEARAADTPTCVYVETQTADTVSGAPPAQAWWDVPVAETATRPSAVKARELYERHVSTRRRHL
ncbi:3D-(3,5/4)-trihydroxycyclohexane-1,2-dione acylhydrolase (Decyclizing) OS=Streptomyces violarus OX=67380 GN=FHS41_003737 PE=3 SV=1 [Streptomyces violarus]